VSDRDTHFQLFALRLWKEMLGEGGYIDINDTYVWDDASMLKNDDHRIVCLNCNRVCLNYRRCRSIEKVQ
jgi:hypothetical protein